MTGDDDRRDETDRDNLSDDNRDSSLADDGSVAAMEPVENGKKNEPDLNALDNTTLGWGRGRSSTKKTARSDASSTRKNTGDMTPCSSRAERKDSGPHL